MVNDLSINDGAVSNKKKASALNTIGSVLIDFGKAGHIVEKIVDSITMSKISQLCISSQSVKQLDYKEVIVGLFTEVKKLDPDRDACKYLQKFKQFLEKSVSSENTGSSHDLNIDWDIALIGCDGNRYCTEGSTGITDGGCMAKSSETR